MAVVGARMRSERGLDAVDRELGGFVAVGVDVSVEPGGVEISDRRVQLIGRLDPDAIVMAVEIAGPAHARCESLDRSVGDDLDEAEVELVGVDRDAAGNACSTRFTRYRTV